MFLTAAMMLFSSVAIRGAIDAMAMAAPAGGDSALYVVLRNSDIRADRLVNVTCTCAARVEIVGENGRRQPWPIAMPPTQLVELSPGASRHLVLRGLTRPLVAGQRVEIVFHYPDGAFEQDMRIVADADAGWTDGPERRARMAPLDALAGWCWRGTSRGGRQTDTRCFSPSYGWDVQERRIVTDGSRPVLAPEYRLYWHDRMAPRISYQATAAGGGRRFGTVRPLDDGLSFVDYEQDGSGHVAEDVATHWRRDGADAWEVVSESLRPGARRELWRLRMVRAGPYRPQ